MKKTAESSKPTPPKMVASADVACSCSCACGNGGPTVSSNNNTQAYTANQSLAK